MITFHEFCERMNEEYVNPEQRLKWILDEIRQGLNNGFQNAAPDRGLTWDFTDDFRNVQKIEELDGMYQGLANRLRSLMQALGRRSGMRVLCRVRSGVSR